MAKRQTRTGEGVQLFPFLAVLVCAMGALIFLLLVTTRMIRQKTIAAAAAIEQVLPPEHKPVLSLPAESIAPPQPQVSPPVSTEPATAPVPLLASQSIELKPVDPVPPEPEVVIDRTRIDQLQSRIQELRSQEQQLSRTATNRQEQLEHLLNARQRTEAELARLKAEQNDLFSQAKLLQQTPDEAEIELVNKQIRTLENRLAGLSTQPGTGGSKFMIVPFDAQTGTTRRPIIIECHAQGLRFVPEDVTITAGDLVGFNEKFNPLLAGATALTRYWASPHRQRLPNEPLGEPYVLLLIRPSGTVAYYAASQMLSTMRQPFGYELIGEETELHMPTVDEEAKRLCEAAVRGLIKEREAVAAAGGLAVGKSGGEFAVAPDDEFAGSGRDVPAGASRQHSAAATGRAIGSIDPRPGRGGSGEHLDPSLGTTGSHQFSRGPNSGNNAVTTNVPAGSPGRPGEPMNGTTPGEFAEAEKLTEASSSAAAQDPANTPAKPGHDSRAIPAKPGAQSSTAKRSEGFTDVPVGEESWQKVEKFGGQQFRTQKQGGSSVASLDEEITQREKAIEEADEDFARLLNSTEGAKKKDGPQEIRPEDVSSPLQQFGESEDNRRRARGMPVENLQRRRWGVSDLSATIGMERPLNVVVSADRLVVDDKFLIRVGAGESKTDTLRMLLLAVDELARDWGRPPKGFYWVPKIQFQVGPGGIQHYERLNPSINRAGLKTSREFILSTPPSTKGTP